eukprot:2575219-Rhodomonas_salina.2
MLCPLKETRSGTRSAIRCAGVSHSIDTSLSTVAGFIAYPPNPHRTCRDKPDSSVTSSSSNTSPINEAPNPSPVTVTRVPPSGLPNVGVIS